MTPRAGVVQRRGSSRVEPCPCIEEAVMNHWEVETPVAMMNKITAALRHVQESDRKCLQKLLDKLTPLFSVTRDAATVLDAYEQWRLTPEGKECLATYERCAAQSMLLKQPGAEPKARSKPKRDAPWHPDGTLDPACCFKIFSCNDPEPLTDKSGPLEATFNKHIPLEGVLFPTAPKLTDINQGDIGNCWLLAALAAILSRPDGGDLIQGMMLDHHDGTVSVRVYCPDPVVLRMPKTVVWVVTRNKVWHSAGPNWVLILERPRRARTAWPRSRSGRATARLSRP